MRVRGAVTFACALSAAVSVAALEPARTLSAGVPAASPAIATRGVGEVRELADLKRPVRPSARSTHAAPRPAPAVAPSPRATASQAGTAGADPAVASVREGAATAWGCAAAVTYLKLFANPRFRVVCPGNSYGRQAMTCFNNPPQCAAGDWVIAVSVPCPAAYMNEAANSWIVTGQRSGAIDAYGWC